MRWVTAFVLFLPSTRQDERSLGELLEKLGSDRVDDRAEAFRQLREMGDAALPALGKAAHDPDQEVAARARGLIEAIVRRPALELFKRMEDLLARTDTLTLTAKVDVRKDEDGKLREIRCEGWLALSGTGKVYFALETWDFGRSLAKTIADGRRVQHIFCIGGMLSSDVEDREARLRAPVARGVARYGVFLAGGGTASFIDLMFRLPECATNGRDPFRLSDMRLVEQREERATLAYTIESDREGPVAEVRLEIETKTGRPLKRSLRAESLKLSFEETYVEFQTDSAIPDDVFHISKN